jgi:hypothetical protein
MHVDSTMSLPVPQFLSPSHASFNRKRPDTQKNGVIVTSPEDLAEMKFAMLRKYGWSPDWSPFAEERRNSIGK